jgi:hypothetical protein
MPGSGQPGSGQHVLAGGLRARTFSVTARNLASPAGRPPGRRAARPRPDR